MSQPDPLLAALWQQQSFTPNDAQRRAILHIDGPLYLPAGPGSGKTRVLLWRTLNLIVIHGVKPEEIYLSTFTKKAALQLKEGLRHLLSLATTHTGQPYDIAPMYVGTVHSLCRDLLLDRRLYPQHQRPPAPAMLDALSQYLFLYRRRRWEELSAELFGNDDPIETIIDFFEDKETDSTSRHRAVTACIALFNRWSEECLDPVQARQRTDDPVHQGLLAMYQRYQAALQPEPDGGHTDLSLLQQKALAVLNGHVQAGQVFKHVIIDEYQDTNTVQERLFFTLAAGSKNLCVVGDDDQAMYRFRGATVENFVEFAQRCQQHLQATPTKIPLLTNYRSRLPIVEFYKAFIAQHDWIHPNGQYRVAKNIDAYRQEPEPAVVVSRGDPDDVCAEIAGFVKRLLETGKVADPNQIAFLFPSLKYLGVMTTAVKRLKEALEKVGLKVYAPRAGRFVEVDESTDLMGVLLQLLGRSRRDHRYNFSDYKAFHDWLDRAEKRGKELLKQDPLLTQFIADRRAELQRIVDDQNALLAVVMQHQWDLSAPYNPATMQKPLLTATGLSSIARSALENAYFKRTVEQRLVTDRPLPLDYVINRATALDWSLLDLFWRLTGFNHFKAMFEAAQGKRDEGPICNLGLLSQYLSRFQEEYHLPIITAGWACDDRLRNTFFSSYLFALFRRGESEYEDEEDPFPCGRIPFITIHQSKGLEFPVVVLGNLRKDDRGPQRVEELVRPLLDRGGEPLDRMGGFDIMRMYYVALSRAKNLLVLAHYTGRGQRINAEFKPLVEKLPELFGLALNTLPAADLDDDDLPQNYSFTGDYLGYQRCPRQYMLFRHYGLVPARSQTMLFGSAVHRTLDDLHQYLIAQRQGG